jgi:hypothetical protein
MNKIAQNSQKPEKSNTLIIDEMWNFINFTLFGDLWV